MYVRGPITPCGLAAGGAVLIRVRTPNLTGTLRHPTGWLFLNFPIALTGDIIFLSQSLLLLFTLHKWYSHAPQHNRLMLSDSERTRIEQIRKGHLRHGHQQLAHTSQRDHKPTTHKWMYYPHTSIEILFEILLKDKLHWRSSLIFLLVFQ